MLALCDVNQDWSNMLSPRGITKRGANCDKATVFVKHKESCIQHKLFAVNNNKVNWEIFKNAILFQYFLQINIFISEFPTKY